MSFNIFSLDWILIDFVIISLLIIVLISVKLFKLKFRWRKNISNEALELVNFDFSELGIQNQHIIVKKAFYLKNKKSEDYRNIIICFFSKKNQKLVHILTEGLASYGCIVIVLNVNFKIKNNDNNTQATMELKRLILNISNSFKDKGLPIDSNCSLISFKNFFNLFYLIDSNPNILRLVLINPNLKKSFFKKISENQNLYLKTSQKICFIFSKKSRFFLKKPSLQNYLKRTSREQSKLFQLKTIEKTNSSFKYYETILLGILIELIKKKTSENNNF